MIGALTRVTEHFSLVEFDQPARHGCPPARYPAEWITERLLPLCQQLELLRTALADRPIRITSGYRTARYNAACGGVTFSQHLDGLAADIVVTGLSAETVQGEVARLLAIGGLPLIRGVGRYPTFTHLDTRPSERIVTWTGDRRST